MDTFSLNKPPELEQEKWMLRVSSLAVLNSVAEITKLDKRIATYAPGFWWDPKLNEKLEELM